MRKWGGKGVSDLTRNPYDGVGGGNLPPHHASQPHPHPHVHSYHQHEQMILGNNSDGDEEHEVKVEVKASQDVDLRQELRCGFKPKSNKHLWE